MSCRDKSRDDYLVYPVSQKYDTGGERGKLEDVLKESMITTQMSSEDNTRRGHGTNVELHERMSILPNGSRNTSTGTMKISR